MSDSTDKKPEAEAPKTPPATEKPAGETPAATAPAPAGDVQADAPDVPMDPAVLIPDNALDAYLKPRRPAWAPER